MKIKKVEADKRRRRFDVTTSRGVHPFPFARCDPAPSPSDRLADVFVDPELAREAFTYRLESGAVGSVHVDAVLDVNADPDHLARLELYRLTMEARRRLDATGLSVRDAASRLGTSPPQLYRLLDPTNYAKSARQLLAVLALGGASLQIIDASARTSTDDPGARLVALLDEVERARRDLDFMGKFDTLTTRDRKILDRLSAT